MDRPINLMKYLPEYLREFEEMQQIMKAENPEFAMLAQEIKQIDKNQYILTCNEAGISLFENILGIKPSAEDTLQSRIARVMIRWNDTSPYVWKVLLERLVTICGNDFDLSGSDLENY